MTYLQSGRRAQAPTATDKYLLTAAPSFLARSLTRSSDCASTRQIIGTGRYPASVGLTPRYASEKWWQKHRVFSTRRIGRFGGFRGCRHPHPAALVGGGAVGRDSPGFHPHELRHTAASLAIASGADVKVVQQMLGHKKRHHDARPVRPPVRRPARRRGRPMTLRGPLRSRMCTRCVPGGGGAVGCHGERSP